MNATNTTTGTAPHSGATIATPNGVIIAQTEHHDLTTTD